MVCRFGYSVGLFHNLFKNASIVWIWFIYLCLTTGYILLFTWTRLKFSQGLSTFIQRFTSHLPA